MDFVSGPRAIALLVEITCKCIYDSLVIQLHGFGSYWASPLLYDIFRPSVNLGSTVALRQLGDEPHVNAKCAICNMRAMDVVSRGFHYIEVYYVELVFLLLLGTCSVHICVFSRYCHFTPLQRSEFVLTLETRLCQSSRHSPRTPL